ASFSIIDRSRSLRTVPRNVTRPLIVSMLTLFAANESALFCSTDLRMRDVVFLSASLGDACVVAAVAPFCMLSSVPPCTSEELAGAVPAVVADSALAPFGDPSITEIGPGPPGCESGWRAGGSGEVVGVLPSLFGVVVVGATPDVVVTGEGGRVVC